MLPPLASTPAGVSEDDWKAACAAVRAYCRWHVAPSYRETVKVDGSGGDVLFLPTHHLTEIHSISDGGRVVTDPEWSEAGMVRGPWSTRFRGVVADITHGHPECPVDVLTLLTAVAKRAPSAGIKSKSYGPFKEDYVDVDLTGYEQSVLDPYRMIAMP